MCIKGINSFWLSFDFRAPLSVPENYPFSGSDVLKGRGALFTALLG